MSKPRVKSAEDAVRRTVADLHKAISCVTKAQLAVDRLRGSGPEGLIAVTFEGRAARAKVDEDLWIAISMNLEPAVDQEDERNWRTHTRRYSFAIFATETGRTEYMAYDYHPPTGVAWPHVHVNGKADWLRGMKKRHIATGRMTIEHFVFLLVDEFDVKPLRVKWREALEENLKVFTARRTW